MEKEFDMEELVNFCKQYGFIFQGSEIYDGLANTWDYGPLGSRIKNAIKDSKAKIMYVCNMMTQPGETDNFKASDHIKVLNKYLKRNVDIIIANDGDIAQSVIDKYKVEEQKDRVIFDKDNLKKLSLKIIHNNYVDTSTGMIRHKVDRLALDIYGYMIDNIKK